jgi:hypothetical protein
MKNVLQPLTALLALPLLNDADARVAVMLTAVPSGAFGVLFAVRYNVASAADRDHAHRKHAAQHRDAHGRDPAVIRLELGVRPSASPDAARCGTLVAR